MLTFLADHRVRQEDQYTIVVVEEDCPAFLFCMMEVGLMFGVQTASFVCRTSVDLFLRSRGAHASGIGDLKTLTLFLFISDGFGPTPRSTLGQHHVQILP